MNWRSRQQKLPTAIALITCVGVLSALIPKATPNIGSAVPSTSVEPSQKLTVQQLHQQAQALTVKVLSTERLGSGFVVKKQGAIYTVLTNAHVLRAGNSPYRLQTSDGRIYPAILVKTSRFQGNDLALLQFSNPSVSYSVATLGSAFSLTVGQDVFASGFAATGNLKFTSGQVSLMLDKALSGGYQVGYSNEIVQGMSGGPLFNRRGEVVGINGLHAYPLWNAPLIFQDGSKATPQLHKKIDQFSFAVPIETMVQLAPASIQLNLQLLPPSASTRSH